MTGSLVVMRIPSVIAFTLGLVFGAPSAHAVDAGDLIARHLPRDPAFTVSFLESLRASVASHPRVLGADAAREEQSYRRREALGELYPQVSVDLDGRQRLASDFGDRFDNVVERSQPETSVDARLTARQHLFDGGGVRHRVRSARDAVSAAQASLMQELSEISLRALMAQYDVALGAAEVALRGVQLSDYRTIRDKVATRYESGRGTRRDVSLAEARLATAEAQHLEAELRLEAARARYREIFGALPSAHKRPAIALDLPATADSAEQAAALNSPRLEEAGYQASSSRESYEAQEGDLFPRLSFEVSATKFDIEEGNQDYDVAGRLVLNYDFYTGGIRGARIDQARQQYARARFEETAVQREVFRDVRIAFDDAARKDRQIAILARAYVANRDSRQLFLEQFEATGGGLLELFEAGDDYYRAATDYLAGVAGADIARFRLAHEMGTLTQTLGVHLNGERAR